MKIVGSNISMYRGDSESIVIVYTKLDGGHLTVGDKVEFTVRESIASENTIIHKEINTFTEQGDAVVPILPVDTHALDFKSYVYDIQVTLLDGTVTTIMAGFFSLTVEVTHG